MCGAGVAVDVFHRLEFIKIRPLRFIFVVRFLSFAFLFYICVYYVLFDYFSLVVVVVVVCFTAHI